MTIRVTTAAIIEADGKFLIVEEIDPIKGRVYNQPAGHVEKHESILEAVVREVQEETGYIFQPESLIGIYHLHANDHDATYLRFCFSGSIVSQSSESNLDPDILAVHWFSHEQIRHCRAQHRSSLVLTAIDDYLQGKRYPLAMLNYIGKEPQWRYDL